MRNRLSVLYAADSLYLPHFAASITSLAYHNRDLILDIHLILGSMHSRDSRKLSLLSNRLGLTLHTHLAQSAYFQGMPLGAHYEESIYYRLLAPEILPGDSCLYLDADTIVLGSIKPLLKIKLEKQLVAAVLDSSFQGLPGLGLRSSSAYFNSGVMLLNLDEWRHQSVKDQVLEKISERREFTWFPDQCGLNAVLDGDWLQLDSCWNYQLNNNETSRPDQPVSVAKPVILHFNGSIKPWHLNCRSPYKRSYWLYRNQSPYVQAYADDLSVRTLARRFLSDRSLRFARQCFRILGLSHLLSR